MSWWGVPPNAARYSVSSCNLAISRHDATNTTLGAAAVFRSQPTIYWADSTYQPRVDPLRVALALLFSLS